MYSSCLFDTQALLYRNDGLVIVIFMVSVLTTSIQVIVIKTPVPLDNKAISIALIYNDIRIYVYQGSGMPELIYLSIE